MPSVYADDGIVFVPSMGIGVILVTPLGFPLQLILQGGDLRHIPDFMVWETLPFGVLAGAIYGAATIVQILAIDALDCKCQPRRTCFLAFTLTCCPSLRCIPLGPLSYARN